MDVRICGCLSPKLAIRFYAACSDVVKMLKPHQNTMESLLVLACTYDVNNKNRELLHSFLCVHLYCMELYLSDILKIIYLSINL